MSPPWLRMGVRGRLLALTFVAVLPFVTLSVALFRGSMIQGEHDAEGEPVAHARMVAHKVDDCIAMFDMVALVLGATAAADLPEITHYDALAARIEPSLSTSGLTEVTFWSLTGNPIGHSAGSESLETIGDRRYFRVAAAGGRGIGQPVRSRSSGEWSIPLSRAVRDRSDGVTAVVSLSIGLADLGRTVTIDALPRGWVATLVDEDDVVIARNEPSSAWIGRNVSDLPGAQEALRSLGSTTRVVGADGVALLAGAVAAREVPWRVFVVASAADAYAPVKTLRTRVLALVAVGVTIALAAVWLTSRQLEAALVSSEERLMQAVRVAQIGIYDYDERTHALIWSAQLRSSFGYDPDHPATIQGFLDRVHPEDRAIIEAAARRAQESGGDGSFEADYRVMRKDGEVRWVSNRGQTFFEGEGHARRPMRTVGAVVDITERHAAEEERADLQAQLMHAQRLETVGRLAGGVAHDFNNMIHVVLSFSELLRRVVPNGQKSSRYLDGIEHAAARARDITRQLLAFSRRQIISPVLTDLNALIRGTQNGLVRLIGEDVELRFVPDEDLWTVCIDPPQVDQVLMNLAVNARDAMPKGGNLTIETTNVRLDESYARQHVGSKPGDYVLLAVSDNGVGMDKETLSHIFEPFFTTKELGKGTGLGLATTYGVVNQNGGFISVYSEPGRGATFKIYLPRAFGQRAAAPPALEMNVEAGGGTVLLVEDEELVRRASTATLEAIGYSVVAASGAAEAIAYCERQDLVIDLLLTDVVMPGISGNELYLQLSALRPGLKVLFTSGYTADVVAHYGILEAGVHFIPKPFGMSDVARKLREVLAGT